VASTLPAVGRQAMAQGFVILEVFQCLAKFIFI
jgi:hypothetical protein